MTRFTGVTKRLKAQILVANSSVKNESVWNALKKVDLRRVAWYDGIQRSTARSAEVRAFL
jgi:hypothetical protein